MAARQARRNVALTDNAHEKLGQFRRALSVRVHRNVTHSEAIVYAISATEATLEWLAAGDELGGSDD